MAFEPDLADGIGVQELGVGGDDGNVLGPDFSAVVVEVDDHARRPEFLDGALVGALCRVDIVAGSAAGAGAAVDGGWRCVGKRLRLLGTATKHHGTHQNQNQLHYTHSILLKVRK